MFALTSSHSFYLYSGAADMRMGFDSLSGVVRSKLGADPLSGQVFVFLNRKKTTIKLLHWENGGFVLYHKRLESGTFEVPQNSGQQKSIQLNWAHFVMMIEGVSAAKMLQRKRYERVAV